MYVKKKQIRFVEFIKYQERNLMIKKNYLFFGDNGKLNLMEHWRQLQLFHADSGKNILEA